MAPMWWLMIWTNWSTEQRLALAWEKQADATS
jgi:hypothetical protein